MFYLLYRTRMAHYILFIDALFTTMKHETYKFFCGIYVTSHITSRIETQHEDSNNRFELQILHVVSKIYNFLKLKSLSKT
jgi:hypothetical protein